MLDRKPFKLQEITAMKFNCMKITQGHLDMAIRDGFEYEIAACRKELVELKHEAMNPQKVLDSIQHKMQGA